MFVFMNFGIDLFTNVHYKGKGAQAKPKKGKTKKNSNVHSSTVTACRVDHLLRSPFSIISSFTISRNIGEEVFQVNSSYKDCV